MQMRDRDDDGHRVFEDEEHTERKSMWNGTSHIPEDPRELVWSRLNPDEDGSKLREKRRAEAGLFALVPRRRLEHVDFSFRPNVESNHLPLGS